MWVPTALAAATGMTGIVLLWLGGRVGRDLALLMATETDRAREFATMPTGARVALKGMLRSQMPLLAQRSGRACVYSRLVIEREVERSGRGPGGGRESERVFQLVSDTEEHVPCRLEDESGTMLLSFEGAKVEARKVFQHYESSGMESLAGGMLSVGGTALGHRDTEWIIPVDALVHVVGTVNVDGRLGPSADGGLPFVVSYKFGEEQVRNLTRLRRGLFIGAMASLVIAVILAASTVIMILMPTGA